MGRGPYKPEDLGERIIEAYNRRRTIRTHDKWRKLETHEKKISSRTRLEDRTIKNTHLTGHALSKLTGIPVNTTRLYAEDEGYEWELNLYLFKKRGWTYQRTMKVEEIPAGRIGGSTPGPFGVFTYPVLPKWRMWLQEDMPRPRENIRRFVQNRPQPLRRLRSLLAVSRAGVR